MKFFRISNFLSLALAVFFGVLLFWTSQSVQEAERKLSRVSHAAMQEEEFIRVLETEWDYLNRPERLEVLARDYLQMSRPASETVVEDAASIPEPVLPASSLSVNSVPYGHPVSLEIKERTKGEGQ